MSASRTSRHFYRNPEIAFKDGFCIRRKSKRVADGLYWKYHYFLPASMMPVIRFLKGYFEILDSMTAVPIVHRYRNSKVEYATTAVNVMYEIRNRLAVEDEMVLGSELISPCPWAVIGSNHRKRLARKEFGSMKQLFKHYEPQVLATKGFNCTVILHRQDQVYDYLGKIALKERKSINLVLAVALLLLYDIVKNCGPDCGELKSVFTNDRRSTFPDATISWARACSCEKTPSGQLWNIARNQKIYSVDPLRIPSRKKAVPLPQYSHKYDYDDFMADHAHYYGCDWKRNRHTVFSDVEVVDLGYTSSLIDEFTDHKPVGSKKEHKQTLSKGTQCGIEIEDIDDQHMGDEHIKMLEGWMGYYV